MAIISDVLKPKLLPSSVSTDFIQMPPAPVQLLYSVHLSAGIVSTADVLDRESVDKYTLTVRATDGGGRSCTSRVYITLSDVNDNAPVFTMSSYQLMIPEDAQINTLLTRVTAIDSDLGRHWDWLCYGIQYVLYILYGIWHARECSDSQIIP